MKAYEMFKAEYEKHLKNMTERNWKIINENAKLKNMSVPDYMMLCIEVIGLKPSTDKEAYWDMINLNNNKLVASNRHRSESGHIDRFWLTKKGLKEFNAMYN